VFQVGTFYFLPRKLPNPNEKGFIPKIAVVINSQFSRECSLCGPGVQESQKTGYIFNIMNDILLTRLKIKGLREEANQTGNILIFYAFNRIDCFS